MEPLIIIAIGGLGLAAAWARSAMRSGHQRTHEVLLRSIADRRGGELRRVRYGSARELVLPLEDPVLIELRLRYAQLPKASVQERMSVELTLQRVLPRLNLRPEGLMADVGKVLGMQDIETGDPDLDRRFVVSSSEPQQARDLLRVTVVRAIFRLFRGEPGTLLWLDIEPDGSGGTSRLVIHRSGWLEQHAPVRELVDAVQVLGHSLVQAWDGPWVELAQARGLAVGKLGQRGAASLVGVIEGLPVEARARRGPDGWRTEVTAWVDSLPGLRVAHRQLADDEGWAGQGVSLGNPVLDMLVTARADDPEALRALLSRDSITEALLPVIHGQPGSTLRHDSVRLVAAGRLREELGDALDDVLALARALRSAAG
jgi:hypothetical protein